MINKKLFRVIIKQDEDEYFVASVPSLPGCHTQAKTLTELRKRVKEVIGLCLEVAKTNSAYRRRITLGEPAFVALDMVEV
ncbi:MAG TPA: type II toxin-antitoxin system HicB family antitoxin [Candidatus Paceibacterota bacterium]